MNKLLYLALFFLLLFYGCQRKSAGLLTKKDRPEILESEFLYMSAKAKFKFRHEGNKISASANVRMKKDSLIWMSVTPGLGVEVARILIDKQKTIILDRVSQKVFELNYDSMSERIGFEIDYDIIQSIMLGNLIKPYQKQKIKKENVHYKYVVKKGIYSFENYIGINSKKLEHILVEDPITKNSISVNYSKFFTVQDQVFPQQILAIINYDAENKEDTEVNIFYSNLSIGPEPLNFPFRIPSKYEKN